MLWIQSHDRFDRNSDHNRDDLPFARHQGNKKGNTMSENEAKLEKMVAEFQRVHPNEGENLRELIATTPELKERFLAAIERGNLESIGFLDAETRSGALGTYDPDKKSIQLPIDHLMLSDDFASSANKLRTTIGHEIEHAVEREAILAIQGKLTKAREEILAGPSPHDYTDALRTFDREFRDREARDEIGGINILAAHLRRENSEATQLELLAKLYAADPDEMQHYLNPEGKAPNINYIPKEGISFNDQFQIETTPENVEAFGRHFYDARGTTLGYLDYLIVQIGEEEAKKNTGNPNPPTVQIDMEALGLYGQMTLPPNIKDTSPSANPPVPLEPVESQRKPGEPLRFHIVEPSEQRNESQPKPSEPLKIHIVEPNLQSTADPKAIDRQVNQIINADTPQAQMDALKRWVATPEFDPIRQEGRDRFQQLEVAQQVSEQARNHSASSQTAAEEPAVRRSATM
jgi:hypothetical protein